MEFRVEVPRGTRLQGAKCKAQADRSVCAWRKGRAFELRAMPFAKRDDTGGLVGLSALALAMLFIVMVMLSQLKATLLATKGVLPPAPPPAYPNLPAVYHAPPPLPKPIEATPSLPREDTKALWVRGLVALCVAVIPALCVAIVADGLSPIPMPWLVSATLLLGGATALLLLRKPDASYALLLWPVAFVAFGVALWMEAVLAAVGVLVSSLMALIAFGLGQLDWSSLAVSGGSGHSNHNHGGSSTSCGSSCASASSCGSSGGSSCGGCGG
jgi:hypothetical protein